MGGRDIDDPAPALFLHQRYSGADHVEACREVDADDRVPFFRREIIDRRDELNSGIVDDDVHRSHGFFGFAYQSGDLVRFCHIGAVIVGLYALPLNFPAEFFDLLGLAETVHDDVNALRGESPGDAQVRVSSGSITASSQRRLAA